MVLNAGDYAALTDYYQVQLTYLAGLMRNEVLSKNYKALAPLLVLGQSLEIARGICADRCAAQTPVGVLLGLES